MRPRGAHRGNRKFLAAVWFGFTALLAAAQAGRLGEDGSGAMWIAPELMPPDPVAERCTRRAVTSRQDPVFEVIRAGEVRDVATHAGSRGRVVTFEWNAQTGELSIAGASEDGVFREVRAAAIGTSTLQARSCGSH